MNRILSTLLLLALCIMGLKRTDWPWPSEEEDWHSQFD